jgi:hypothetical protein
MPGPQSLKCVQPSTAGRSVVAGQPSHVHFVVMARCACEKKFIAERRRPELSARRFRSTGLCDCDTLRRCDFGHQPMIFSQQRIVKEPRAIRHGRGCRPRAAAAGARGRKGTGAGNKALGSPTGIGVGEILGRKV